MKNTIAKAVMVVAVGLLVSCLSNAHGQWVQKINLQEPQFVSSLLAENDTIFAGTSQGILRSVDSGSNWINISAGLSVNNETIYIPALAIFHGIYFASTNNAIYRSTNDGATWNVIDTSFFTFQTFSFAANDSTIIAGTLETYLYSFDSGATWSYMQCGEHDYDVPAIIAAGKNFYASIGLGFEWSSNNGICWQRTNSKICNILLNTSSIMLSGNTLFIGSRCGVSYSTDTGASWIDASIGLPDSANVNALLNYNGVFFTGVEKGIYISTNNGNSWSSAGGNLTDSTVREIVICGNYLFAATDHGVWRRPLSDFGISTVDESQSLPSSALALLQNYPNPFSSTTTIDFTLPEDENITSLKVYDALGREVSDLTNQVSRMGRISPMGKVAVEFDASGLPAGVYYYRLTAGKDMQSGEMAVIK